MTKRRMSYSSFIPQPSSFPIYNSHISFSLPHPGTTMWPDAHRVTSLLDRAKAGDAAAVGDLLAQCREPLRRAVDLRLDPALLRREDASDIVQKVLLDAHRRLADYLADPKMPFALWLRHMAQDRIIGAHHRHREAERRSIDREQPPQAPAWNELWTGMFIGQTADPDGTP